VYHGGHGGLRALIATSPGKGNAAMILFPALMVGGHLMIQVVDNVPVLNFEPLCREAATGNLGIKEEFETCAKQEGAARDALAKQWSEFNAADRARCVRASATNGAASYVEVLTCLELDRDAKKLHQPGDAAIAAPEPAHGPSPEEANQPTRSARASAPGVSPPPPPLPLSPQPAPSGFPQALCIPGLKAILPACSSSGGTR
jgi:hypothetical protein